MGEKIILNKRVAVALEKALGLFGKDRVLEMQSEVFEKWNGELEPLNELSLVEMAKVLYQGYEVEETPEQKLAKTYQYYKNEAYTTDMTSYANGIEHALSVLGIKIEGINK